MGPQSFISGNMYINRNQTFILDSHRAFICSVQSFGNEDFTYKGFRKTNRSFEAEANGFYH
jgi:hypothetical protein